MQVTTQFQSKQPYKTNWLVLTYPANEPPEKLIKDLGTIGWYENKTFAPSPLNGVKTATFNKDGTAFFKEWTDTERRFFMTQVRALLKRHGFNNVPLRKLTLADMI